MPHARIFPFGGREKNPRAHQNPVAWFPVQLACCSSGFYSHHQSGLTDREQTSGSPWTHSVPFPSQNKHQVIARGKNYFPDIEASSEKTQLCDSRQSCYLEGGALNGQAIGQMILWATSKPRLDSAVPQILCSWALEQQFCEGASMIFLITAVLAWSLSPGVVPKVCQEASEVTSDLGRVQNAAAWQGALKIWLFLFPLFI